MEIDRKKTRLVTVDVGPLRPIQSFSYRCDNKFHVETLKSLCVDENEAAFGFIIVDGNGALFGLLQGRNREVLQSVSVDLPNKTRRGGQSALRFERLCREKRDIYIRKVATLAIEHFLVGNHPRVSGLVVGGLAGCKDDLLKSPLSKRLRPLVVHSLCLAYGGRVGFDQAIEKSAEIIGSIKLLEEKRVLERFMDEMSQDTGKYCLSVEETIQALEMGAVEDLIVWEDLAVDRYEIFDKEAGEKRVLYLAPEKAEIDDFMKKELLIDWILDNHGRFGCRLFLVSDQSSAGRQFACGLGGIGGVLRWKVDFDELGGSKSNVESEIEDGSDDEKIDVEFDDGDFGF